MQPIRPAFLLVTALSLGAAAIAEAAPSAADAAAIQAFNQAYNAAIRSQDNARVLALWAADGVSLLPGEPALRGRDALARFLDRIQAEMRGWKVKVQEMQCHDLVVHGDLASEWCDTHQVVSRPDGKPDWEGRGKMSLVLQRIDGQWRVRQESWNEGPASAGS
ncbi:MAG: SgcJ/EcaC family oxidoreductase [Roseateles sp.]|jgi:uncharacterized protein (TIGR02246 family)|nr:hypothetical protein [Methylibium sp.]MBY0364630.1 nuclear transport factor 2 family protein [Burkholderiaceae bacterium]